MITIVPFEDIAEAVINKIKNKLQEKFNVDIKITKNKILPDTRKRGSQLLANDFIPIIAILSKDYGLGITNQDLYVPELNFVFGIALGKHCIISLARLKGNKLMERAVKEAVHELGHCYSLHHCPNPKCVMHFSNCLEDTDIKEENFCERCKNLLNKNFFS